MKITYLLLLLCCSTLVGMAQDKVFPVVKGYGGVLPLTEREDKPDTAKIYYLLADVKAGASTPDQVAAGWEKVATAINLHVQSGIPLRNIRLAIVVSGTAAATVLGANSYLRTFGYANPHLRLMDQLAAITEDIYVCGQTWQTLGYRPDQLLPQVKLAFSALTINTHFSQKGYTILTF